MAVAVTFSRKRVVHGSDRVVVADLVFSSNYAAGGESLTPAMLGLSIIDHISFGGGVAVSTALTTADVVAYNYATNKVLMYQTGTAADAPLNEKGAEAYITGCTVRVMAFGR